MAKVKDFADRFKDGALPKHILDDAVPEPANDDKPPAKPTIHVRPGELPEQVDGAALALLQSGLPIYDFSGGLVVVQRRKRASRAAAVRLHAERIKPGRAKFLLALAANWERSVWDKREQAWVDVPTNPPGDVIEALLDGASQAFPALARIVTTPFLLSDGEVVTAPGYHEPSGIYFDPCGVDFPPIPSNPSREDALAALAVIDDLVCDFPFANESTKAAALAAILTPVVRSAIDGPVPLFLIHAHAAGTGKGKLVNVAGIIATGAAVPCMSSVEEAEFEKRIVSALLGGQPMLLIDNVRGKIGSATLDALLTTDGEWSGRLLGKSETVNLPMQLVVYVTGNNLKIGGDLARRCIPVFLDSKLERPEHRTDFRHPKLVAHVKANRARAVAAVLTIVKAYLAAGAPEVALKPLGSFEAWTAIVRAPLVWLGCADPVAGQEVLREDADDALAGWRDALAALAGRFKGDSFTAAAVVRELEPGCQMHGARNFFAPLVHKGELTGLNLAAVFRSRHGRIVNGLRLQKSAEKRRNDGFAWVVAPMV